MSLRAFLKMIATAAADRLPWLVDCYRLAANPRWEVANRRDFRRTYGPLRWLRSLPKPTDEGKTALIVLRREDIFDIKSNLMLGKALSFAGVRAVVLANHRRVPRILRYMKAFGVEAIEYRDAHAPTGPERRGIEDHAREMLAGHLTFADVREWTYRGHPLGERVLSTLIRSTLDPEPDLGDPAVRSELERILREVLITYHMAESVLDTVEPTWILADEIGYAVNGPLVDLALAQDRQVIVATPYLRDGALMFKRTTSRVRRAGPSSVSRATLERLEESPWTARQEAEVEHDLRERYGGRSALQRMYQWNTRPVTPEEICQSFDLDPAKPIAVVFSHVLWDASFFYGEDLFVNYREWLEQTLLAAIGNPRVNWLVKTHPSNAFRLAHGDVAGPVAEVELVRKCVEELPPHVRLVLPETHISSLALYRHADIGVTVRGTPGLEMACFGKPVLTAGTGHYSGLGFTLDSSTAEEYLARLRHIETFLEPLDQRSRSRARRYTHALFRLRPWVARSFQIRLDFPEQGWHPLDRNVVPIATSLAEARANGDLERWARWVVRSSEADYLSIEELASGAARSRAEGRQGRAEAS